MKKLVLLLCLLSLIQVVHVKHQKTAAPLDKPRSEFSGLRAHNKVKKRLRRKSFDMNCLCGLAQKGQNNSMPQKPLDWMAIRTLRIGNATTTLKNKKSGIIQIPV